MGRNEYLGSPLLGSRMLTKLPGKRLKQLVVKAVLGFLDAQEGRRCRILEKQKVGENLEGAVRHLLSVEWVFKSPVIEPNEEPAIWGLFRVDAVYPWNLPCDSV